MCDGFYNRNSSRGFAPDGVKVGKNRFQKNKNKNKNILMKVRKITMKQRKGKFTLGMKIASILSCLALVSVGFASWWIVQYPTETTTTQGNFDVYTVGTKKVEIGKPTFTPEADANIVFGKQLKDGSGKDVVPTWLLADDVAEQNLDAQFTFIVSMKDVKDGDNGQPIESASTEPLNKYLSEIKFTLDDVIGSATNAVATPIDIQGAVQKGYLKEPVLTYSYKNTSTSAELKADTTHNWENGKFDFSIDTSAANCSSITVTVTVKFDWGTAFNETNPYVYYNAQDYDAGLATSAQTALKGLYALTDATYKVTIEAVPGNSVPNS